MFEATTMRDPTQAASITILSPVDVRITCGGGAVRDGLARVMDALAPLHLNTEERGTVELVLAEVLNNIAEHAYAPVGSGPISIRADHRADGLHFRINDLGRAMPDGRAPAGQVQDIDMELNDLPEGGFGWFMIRDLAHNVTYRRVGDENQLDLRLAVAMTRAN